MPEAGFAAIETMVAAVVVSIGVVAGMRNFGKAVCLNQGQGELAVQTAPYCQNKCHRSSR